MVNLLLVTAGALIDRDGRILLAKRPEDKPMAGLWEFPGGKLQDNETPEAALVRELNEELGVDTQTSCLAPIGFSSIATQNHHLLLFLFICRKWSGIALGREKQTLKWVKPEDLLNYEMPKADIPLAAQLKGILCPT